MELEKLAARHPRYCMHIQANDRFLEFPRPLIVSCVVVAEARKVVFVPDVWITTQVGAAAHVDAKSMVQVV
jgi:hypothetical protein